MWANLGDIIVIDSKDYSVTKNGVNYLSKRREWSIRPMVKWNTKFLIFDGWWGLYGSSFDIKIIFKDVLK